MKIIKVFPDWLTGKGIFSELSKKFDFLSSDMDIEYFGNVSGDKESAPLIDKFVEANIDYGINSFALTDAQRTTLAGIIARRFNAKWGKLSKVQNIEYNPIENYSMKQTETPNITHDRTINIDNTDTETRKTATDKTTTETPTDYKVTREHKEATDTTTTTDNNTNANAYGFNSTTEVPTNSATGNGTVTVKGDADKNVTTDTETRIGNVTTREQGEADKNTENTTTTTKGKTTDVDKETGTRRLERSGNIGVTTSQQMIKSEIELWQWNFIQMIYKDVDSVLTCPKYNFGGN